MIIIVIMRILLSCGSRIDNNVKENKQTPWELSLSQVVSCDTFSASIFSVISIKTYILKITLIITGRSGSTSRVNLANFF